MEKMTNTADCRKEGKAQKSQAKAAGLKSTFVLNQETGEMLMTSFGKGNKARLDKYIREDKIVDAGEETYLRVSSDEKKKSFRVSGRKREDAEAGNPMLSQKTPGDDLIHCRSKLETMYFGKTFQDNIHIQSKFKHDIKEKYISEDDVNKLLPHYFYLVNEHRTYCKDFVKALNVPFAYNLPRYKNLSIKELFDRNDYKPNKGKEWEQ